MARQIEDIHGPISDLVVDSITANTVITASQNGTVTTAATTTAVEHGSAVDHLTVLTLASFAVGTSADTADLAIGASLYTFPAGAILVENATFTGTITADTSEATIADGEIGLGTTVGSTAVDTLGEVDAAAENVLGPIVVTSGEFDGAEVFEGATASNLFIASGGDHAVFFNIAATWPNVTAAGAVTADGVVTLKWRTVS
jgi:hypothetical protein